MKPLTNLKTRFTLEKDLGHLSLYNFEVFIRNSDGIFIINDTVFNSPAIASDIIPNALSFMEKVFGKASTVEHPCFQSYRSQVEFFQPHLACIGNDGLYDFYLTSKDMAQKGLKIISYEDKGVINFLWRVLSYIYEEKLVNKLIEGIE